MDTRRVRVVAFDVNETLFSLAPLAEAFARIGLAPDAVPRWFAQLLRDGFALAAIGQYRTFGELAAETLRAQDPGRVDDAAVRDGWAWCPTSWRWWRRIRGTARAPAPPGWSRPGSTGVVPTGRRCSRRRT
jgi:hypothetical protein